MKNDEIMKKDIKYNWHPCTQMKDHETLPIIPIKKAYGVYLEDFENNKYIDAISSWWVNIFGHTNEYINSKIKEQLNNLEHTIFAGFTHEGAIKLSERLCNLTGLDKVFYADNGSSAVEIALKMSFHYNLNKGNNKSKFFSLKNSYHGETIGALSVGDVDLYKKTYEPLLLKTIALPIPENQGEEETKKALEDCRVLFQKHYKEISALIIEPLVQCAGNMKMHSPDFVKGLSILCKEFNIHLIADEIAVGFGRTGSMFAYEQAKIRPDFVCLSKGLTGGYMSLSAVLTSDEIYSAFYCDYVELKAFLHSHSYTANPIALSAANASLDLFEKYNVIKENRKKSAYIWDSMQKFRDLKNVKEIRQTGMISAIEMIDYPFEKRMGLKVYEYGLKNGVLIRPLGNVIYFMPPYIITFEEIDKMINVAYEGIRCLEDK